jgi:hypothetical protein
MPDNEKQLNEEIQKAQNKSITIAQIIFLLAFFGVLALDMFGKKPVPYVGFFAGFFAAAAIGMKPEKIGEVIAAFFKKG